MIRNNILRVLTQKRFWVALAVLILCLIFIALNKSCTARDVQDYALETVSAAFEPLVTPVNEQLTQGEQLNTRLLYASYITLFDNWKYRSGDELRRRLLVCFYDEAAERVEPVKDAEAVFNRIQNQFGLVIDDKQRKDMLALSKTLAIGWVNSTKVLTRNLYTQDGAKSNIGLVNFAWNALNCNSGYVFGAVGQTINTSFLQQQQRRFAENERANLTQSQVGSIFINFGGRPGFDCIGLIKAYSWLDESTGEISSKHQNAMPDCNANGLYEIAGVKGDIAAMPDIPGLAVQKDGHVGVYIGGGEVIEARGNELGVAKTKLKGRGWLHYVQVPTLTYVQSGTYRIQNKSMTIADGKIVNTAN